MSVIICIFHCSAIRNYYTTCTTCSIHDRFFSEHGMKCTIQSMVTAITSITASITYGIYISQLVRIGRICSSYNQFCDRHYKLTEKLIAQGFRYVELCKAFKKFARSHADIFNKYSYSIRRCIQDGICLPACDTFLGCRVSTHRGSKGLCRR